MKSLSLLLTVLSLGLSMKRLQFITIFISLFLSLPLSAAVFKCKAENGKVTYQAAPCPGNVESSEIKIQKSTTSESSVTKKSSDPSGRWANAKGMTANLSVTGSFQMTDISGAALTGSWSENNGAYRVSAKFQGEDFPVNMKYEIESDTLFLSKPGMPNTLVKYERR